MDSKEPSSKKSLLLMRWSALMLLRPRTKIRFPSTMRRSKRFSLSRMSRIQSPFLSLPPRKIWYGDSRYQYRQRSSLFSQKRRSQDQYRAFLYQRGNNKHRYYPSSGPRYSISLPKKWLASQLRLPSFKLIRVDVHKKEVPSLSKNPIHCGCRAGRGKHRLSFTRFARWIPAYLLY